MKNLILKKCLLSLLLSVYTLLMWKSEKSLETSDFDLTLIECSLRSFKSVLKIVFQVPTMKLRYQSLRSARPTKLKFSELIRKRG